MPIKVEDFSWSETEQMVFITVPLKGVKPAKADVYSNELYIKVNYPPFFFEADLYDAIDDSTSSATVGKGAVEFKLQKLNPGLWGKLQTGADKAALKKRREVAQEKSREKQELMLKDEKMRQTEQRREAVQKQMALDKAEQKKLDDLKEAEKRKASADIEAVEAAAGNASDPGPQSVSSPKATAVEVRGEASTAPVRKTSEIKVSFTARAFKTAARESKRGEEEEWLANQAAARKAVQEAKQFAKDLGVENDPLWLKDKGNEFFKKGDYKGAINAYTAGITLNSRMAPLFSNRAACHLKLDDFYAAANDCSKALSLLTPPVEENRKSRLIAFSRRSAALAGIGDFESAISDVRSALELDPNNEALRADLIELNKKRVQEDAR
eukprot:m.451469 g.451469  ORF g.451469 m.451469 type:complete len:382 (+) comp20161_c0_seq1:29-1174(+)